MLSKKILIYCLFLLLYPSFTWADPTDQFSGNPIQSIGQQCEAIIDSDVVVGTVTVSGHIATLNGVTTSDTAFSSSGSGPWVGVGDIFIYNQDGDGLLCAFSDNEEYGIIKGIELGDPVKLYITDKDGSSLPLRGDCTTQEFEIYRQFCEEDDDVNNTWILQAGNDEWTESAPPIYELTDRDLTDDDDEDGPLYVAVYNDEGDDFWNHNESSLRIDSNWDTDADDKIIFFAPNDTAYQVARSQRHVGAFDLSYAGIRTGAVDAGIQQFGDSTNPYYLDYIGLQFYLDVLVDGNSIIKLDDHLGVVNIDMCIFKGPNGGDYSSHLVDVCSGEGSISGPDDCAGIVNITNSLFFDNGTKSSTIAANITVAYCIETNISNCTIIGGHGGIEVQGDEALDDPNCWPDESFDKTTVINTVCTDMAGDGECFYDDDIWEYQPECDYNIVATGESLGNANDGGHGSVSTQAAAALFTSPGSDDYSVLLGSDLINSGVDLSSGDPAVTTDITGAARTGTFEVGAFLYVPPPTYIMILQ